MLSTISEDEQETQEALVTPLLVSTNNNNNSTTYNRGGNKITDSSPHSTPPHEAAQQNFADESSPNLSVEMSSTNLAGSPSAATPSFGRRLTDPRFCPPLVQGILFRLLGLKSAADSLPFPFDVVVTNGKMAAPVYLGVNLALVLLWLPFWALSFLMTEWGIYLTAVGTVFLIGRAIIRFIAFPGASRKMTLDMEREFSKYALRMLMAAAESTRETGSCLLQACSANPNESAKQMLPALWRRTDTYKKRVLSVFLETLLVLHQEQSAESFQRSDADLTKDGNNRLAGDVGNLGSITPEARALGLELMQQLQQLLPLLDGLEEAVKTFSQKGGIFGDGISSAKSVIDQSTRLLDLCESLRQAVQGASSGDDQDDDDEDPVNAVRRQMEEGNSSTWDAIKSGLSSLQAMLDPNPHPSIFCMDFLRGCVLSRYRGSRQLWVRRPLGGMIDVLHFPAKGVSNNKKALLYCNPNAGLIEVATGLNMVGGNVPAAEADPSAPKDTWTDFYTELGFDVYLFNYAGYGRSYGSGICTSSAESDDSAQGALARCRRVFHSWFLAFKPRPDTLRADGIAVAEHILDGAGVTQLFIHGESIGGMAASGVAKYLTNKPSTKSKVSFLVCDRTFCNLEAIAQRLVGEWTGNAIRALTFYSWSTDVAGDFIEASCPKVVANDAADAIIADDASLKSGVAIWKEIHRGMTPTGGIAWMSETPLRYRMADFENASVNDSKYAASALHYAQPPVWPTDKHVSVGEAIHFAACCKRIGKMATALKRNMSLSEDERGNMTGDSELLAIRVWKYLATCDGLVGAPLGASVKRGYDATVAWLCSTLIFGGQIVVASAETRLGGMLTGPAVVIEPSDFDQRPPGSPSQTYEGIMHPTPIPEVASFIEQALESGDSQVSERKCRVPPKKLLSLANWFTFTHGQVLSLLFTVAHEYKYVAGTLRYAQNRLSAPVMAETALAQKRLQITADNSVGSFMKLNCGHNNAFTEDEKRRLRAVIEQATNLSTTDQPASLAQV